jgi:hypothetical protein
MFGPLRVTPLGTYYSNRRLAERREERSVGGLDIEGWGDRRGREEIL